MASSSADPGPDPFQLDDDNGGSSRQSLGRRMLTRAKSVLRKKDGSKRFSLQPLLSRTDQPPRRPSTLIGRPLLPQTETLAAPLLAPETFTTTREPVPSPGLALASSSLPPPASPPLTDLSAPPPAPAPAPKPAPAPAPAPPPAVSAQSAQSSPPQAFKQSPQQTLRVPPSATRRTPEVRPIQQVSKRQLYESRAFQMDHRLGVEMFPAPWHASDGYVLRVDQPVRMRIRRRCHECDTGFGGRKQCPNCQHAVCHQCTRTPPRLAEPERAAKNARVQVLLRAQKDTVLVPDPFPDPALDKKPFVIIRPSKPMTKLVFKKPRQRIRRRCCQCCAMYMPSAKACSTCAHDRCTDCPRDPAKKNKFPCGYPGDVPGHESNAYHQCHLCQKVFVQGAPANTKCDKCGHPRCDQCSRMPPHRVEPEPDPEVLQRVLDILGKLGITNNTTSSSALEE